METKLEVLKRALEEGASIEIKYHSTHGLDEQQAKEKAEEIATDLGIEYKQEIGEGSSWFCEKDYGTQVAFSVFYRKSKEDKIRSLEEQLKALKEETA